MPRKSKAMFMENTEVSPSKSAADITDVLVSSGARKIQMEYGDGGKIVGMSFEFQIPGIPHPYIYKMPVRTETIYKELAARRQGYLDNTTKARLQQKAERVAWRQLFRWTQVQMAMVDMGMAKTAEVFMPYMQADGGQSLFQLFEAQQLKQLEAPKE